MNKGYTSKKERYSENDIKRNRTFPVWGTILLVVIVAAQIGLIVLGICYQPKPQDLIHLYKVTVQPLEDGSLDIEYRLVWEALDEDEDLTWVEIGMANENFSVYPDSVSSNIKTYSTYSDSYYVSLQLDFENAYSAGDVIDFSFKINQRNMLCENGKGYFYEFVPGWFNAIQVKEYEFLWLTQGAKTLDLRGSLDYGEYRTMFVQYGKEDFDGCRLYGYEPFDDEDAYDELAEDKGLTVIACCLVAILLIVAEVYIVDSYVSYRRGRGFLNDYGYYVHTYGRRNPHYVRARDKYNAKHGNRSGRGGGCACACACAGGGRAGCSQKDTYGAGEISS